MESRTLCTAHVAQHSCPKRQQTAVKSPEEEQMAQAGSETRSTTSIVTSGEDDGMAERQNAEPVTLDSV
jgi:hypothetical protein